MHCLRLSRTLIRRSSLWSNVPKAPADPIFGVAEAFKNDTNPKKVNLSVGAYRTNEGKPFLLDSVLKAEKIITENRENKEYAPIAGIQEFCNSAAALAFGSDSPVIKESVNATVQSVSGSGALKLGGEFIRKFFPGVKEIFLPEPTWANHKNIFSSCGLKISMYRYYKPSTKGLDEDGLLSDIDAMPENSIILLHACAHNPTGVDPNAGQWKKISDGIKKRKLLPFFDMAYQGFASGDLKRDAAALRLFINEGHKPFLAQSFAKNMGLYGERTGALTIVCGDMNERNSVISQLKPLIRSIYSNPPIHGARIAHRVLTTPDLTNVWYKDLRIMADRINEMRQELVKNLKAEGSKLNWNHVTDQIGMFCYTGLTSSQVEQLTKNYSIYLTKDGRISVSGLNTSNNAYVAKAIHEVTK